MNQPTTPNFDRIARAYRWLEYLSLGPALQRTRIHFLPLLLDRRRALLLGDGDGRFLAEFLRSNPSIHAVAVDCSAAMLHLLRRRALTASPTAASRLRTQQIDALAYAPDGGYDLVVTHFFLDCLTQAEVHQITAKLAACLEPRALWLVSEVRVPHGLIRRPARICIRLLYAAFRILTGLRVTQLPDHAAAFTAAGLICIARKHRLAGLLSAELWQKM